MPFKLEGKDSAPGGSTVREGQRLYIVPHWMTHASITDLEIVIGEGP